MFNSAWGVKTFFGELLGKRFLLKETLIRLSLLGSEFLEETFGNYQLCFISGRGMLTLAGETKSSYVLGLVLYSVGRSNFHSVGIFVPQVLFLNYFSLLTKLQSPKN